MASINHQSPMFDAEETNNKRAGEGRRGQAGKQRDVAPELDRFRSRPRFSLALGRPAAGLGLAVQRLPAPGCSG